IGVGSPNRFRRQGAEHSKSNDKSVDRRQGARRERPKGKGPISSLQAWASGGFSKIPSAADLFELTAPEKSLVTVGNDRRVIDGQSNHPVGPTRRPNYPRHAFAASTHRRPLGTIP